MSSEHIQYGGDQYHCTEWERAFSEDKMEQLETEGKCPFCGDPVDTAGSRTETSGSE